MRKEAAGAGFYKSPWGSHPRIQLLTVSDLLKGKSIDYPAARQTNVTYRKARAFNPEDAEQLSIATGEVDEDAADGDASTGTAAEPQLPRKKRKK